MDFTLNQVLKISSIGPCASALVTISKQLSKRRYISSFSVNAASHVFSEWLLIKVSNSRHRRWTWHTVSRGLLSYFFVSACPVLRTFNCFTLVHGLHVLIRSVKSNFHETLATEKSRPQIIRVVAAEYFPAGQLIVSASCAVPINLPYIQSGNWSFDL